MDTFRTRSTSRKQLVTISITCLVMALAALLALNVGLPAFLYIEGMLLFVWLFTMLFSRKVWWEIVFQDDTLYLRNNGNNQRYSLTNLKLSDFTFKQNSRQKQNNCGDLRIQDTPFGIFDVQDFDQLRQYIQRHYH